MGKLTIGAIGAVSLASLVIPTAAQAHWDRHAEQHEQLDEEHAAIHDALEEEHARAHEEGLTPWEHAELHRELENQHEEADYALELEHQRQHMREQWRRQYDSGYGYGGYGYDGYGYRRHHRHFSFGFYGF